MTYLAFLWPLLWLAHAIWAPVKIGKANRSNLLGIERARAEVGYDGNRTAFAVVQERGEFRLYKGMTAAIGAVGIGVAIAFEAPLEALLIGAAVGLTVIEALVRMLSAIDIAGHGAEIMAAEAALTPDEAVAYRLREAKSVARQYDIEAVEALVWIERSQWLARIIYVLGK